MNLTDAMRRQYSASKAHWRVHFSIEVTRLLAAAYLVLGGQRVLTVSALAIVAPIASYFVRRTADVAYGHAERMRRLLYLQDGLGREPTRADLLELRADATWLPDLEPLPVGSYYSSALPRGPRRLAHICEEAAFHTRGYACAAATAFFVIAAVGVLFAAMLLWYAIHGAIGAGQATLLARFASSLLTFFAAGSFVSMALAFQALRNAAQRAFERLDRLASSNAATAADVLLVIGAYDCALAKAPAIPTLTYRALRSRLNEAWDEHGRGRL